MLNKMCKRLSIVFAAVFALLFGVRAVYSAVTGEIQRFYVDSSGTAELSGYFDNTEQNSTTMLLTTDADEATIFNAPNENIMYIEQPELGNNGTFYMHFPIDEKFSTSNYVLRMNGGTLLTTSGTLREIPAGISKVADNAIRVGNDAYDIGCNGYTPNNISKSIERGGNKIYYKIGGKWFDMLNPKATSTAYFTDENAVPESEWDLWEIDTYYHY